MRVEILSGKSRLNAQMLHISNGARNGQLPARLKILDWGRNETLKGIFIVDEITAQCFDANQKKVGRDRVCLDFEHNTVPGSEEFARTKEPRDVAGYWTPKVIPGEGIFLEAPEWTPIGKEKALNFEDISATPFVDGDRVIGLHSVALTRAGASEVTFFSANSGVAALQGRPLFGFARMQYAIRRERELEALTFAPTPLSAAEKQLRGFQRTVAAFRHETEGRELGQLALEMRGHQVMLNGAPLSVEQLRALGMPALKALRAEIRQLTR